MSLFSIVSVLISLAAVASYINFRYIKLPTTIGVMIVALLASMAVIIAGPYAPGFREHTTAMMSRIDFNETVLHGMLAFLLFAGSIHVDLHEIKREWAPISLLAIFGTLLSTFIVGGLLWLVLRWANMEIPLIEAMLFGALISPTDPIAVLGIMKSVGAPKQLEVQTAGESLFNDGIGVVIFLVLLEVSGLGGPATSEHGMDAGTVALMLVKEIGGALILGMGVGLLAYYMLIRVDNYQVEVLITLALAMGGYALADALHLSAPIAIVVAGVFIGNTGRQFAMSEKTNEHVDTFWELIDEVLNAVLFLLIGLELLVLPINGWYFMAGVVAIPIVLFARWLSVSSVIFPLSWMSSQAKGAISVLTWGGLRGGISVAMALSLPASNSRSLLLTVTYCVVVFSIVVQGSTIGQLIRKRTTPDAPPALPGQASH